MILEGSYLDYINYIYVNESFQDYSRILWLTLHRKKVSLKILNSADSNRFFYLISVYPKTLTI